MIADAPAVRRGAVASDAAIVLAASLAVRAAFLWFKGPHAFSTDLGAWLEVGWAMAAGKNPYLATTYFVWPPVWVQILYALHRVGALLGVPLEFVITGFLIVVECGLVVALLALLRDLGVARRRRIVLAGIALNPVCAILVCEHGNFDVLVALLVLLAVAALLRFRRSAESADWLLACLWLGLAIALKSVPALLAPLLLAGARRATPRVRAFGAALVIGPAAYGLGVLHVLRAGDVRVILGYRSIPGWFGATGWFHRIGRDAWMLPYSWASQLALLLLAAVLGVLAWRGRLDEPRRLVAAAAIILVAAPAIGPGYGPQYFYWFWPLVLASYALGGARLRRWVVVFAVVAAATYLVEYGLVGFLGAFLAYRFPAARDAVFGPPPGAIPVFTVLRTPLWLAYLALLWNLARELRGAPRVRTAARNAPAPRTA